MKVQPYVDKLNESPEFKDFKQKNSDAFLVAGFFILDLEFGKNIHQVDFFIPSKKKFAAFTLDGKVNVQILDTVTDKTPEKLDIKTEIDLDALKGIIEDEMKNRNMTEEIKKIIAVVQCVKGKKIWNINSVLSGMEILKAHIEDCSQTVLKMEKTSLTDIMKKMPQMPMPGQKIEAEEKDPVEAEEEIEKLNKLEKDIEKEKQRLKKIAGAKKTSPKATPAIKAKSSKKLSSKTPVEEEAEIEVEE